jgi:tRNA threonylcarbamoyladenosine biosynthesis protein TsaE
VPRRGFALHKMCKAQREEPEFETITRGPEETLGLGRRLGELLSGGEFIALMGELGSGKTVLAKGIARGLGVVNEDEVTSPSFVLVNEYRGRVPVYHVDLYRLEDPAAVEGIGWEEFVSGPGVTLVEWAEKAETYLPGERIDVHLQWLGEEERKIHLCGRGPAGRERAGRLKEIWMKEE